MKIPIYLCSVLMFLCAGLCAAQQNVTSATLSGRVEDARGSVVSGASLTAIHVETNQQLKAPNHDQTTYCLRRSVSGSAYPARSRRRFSTGEYRLRRTDC